MRRVTEQTVNVHVKTDFSGRGVLAFVCHIVTRVPLKVNACDVWTGTEINRVRNVTVTVWTIVVKVQATVHVKRDILVQTEIKVDAHPVPKRVSAASATHRQVSVRLHVSRLISL